jgi:hypothetical protein
MTVIREETIAVQRETLEDEDLENALAAFEPHLAIACPGRTGAGY